MLTFRQIEVFTAVMRAGSLICAARDLRISQPTITRMILRIEDQLSLRLFERVRGRLIPTPEARRFLTEVDRAFEHMRAAIDRAAETSRPGQTPFRVGASPSLGRGLAPDALRRLTAAFPDLSIQLDVLSVSQVLAYLVDRAGEAALTLYPILHHDVTSTRVGEGRPVLVLPHAPEFDGVATLNDLVGAPVPWLVFRELSAHGEAMAAIFQQHEIHPRRTHGVRFAESAIALAEAGLGATIVDEFSAGAALTSRVRCLPIDSAIRFPVYLHRGLASGVGTVADAFEVELRRELSSRATSSML